MIYPFLNDIGKMKVSEAINTLGVIASERKLDFAILPERSDGKTNIHLIAWRGNAFLELTKIMRNNQRNN